MNTYRWFFLSSATLKYLLQESLEIRWFWTKSNQCSSKNSLSWGYIKNSKTVYLWGLVPKNDNQCNFWQNLHPYIFKISASWGRVAQGLAVFQSCISKFGANFPSIWENMIHLCANQWKNMCIYHLSIPFFLLCVDFIGVLSIFAPI